MTNKVVITDSELGDFVYERDPEDSFKWSVAFPGRDGSRGKPSSTIDGTELLWQVAVAAQEDA